MDIRKLAREMVLKQVAEVLPFTEQVTFSWTNFRDVVVAMAEKVASISYDIGFKDGQEVKADKSVDALQSEGQSSKRNDGPRSH